MENNLKTLINFLTKEIKNNYSNNINKNIFIDNNFKNFSEIDNNLIERNKNSIKGEISINKNTIDYSFYRKGIDDEDFINFKKFFNYPNIFLVPSMWGRRIDIYINKKQLIYRGFCPKNLIDQWIVKEKLFLENNDIILELNIK